MITCFPTLYPDELLYSLFARYYAQSGHIAYVFAAEELFESRTTKPDIELINALTPEAISSPRDLFVTIPQILVHIIRNMKILNQIPLGTPAVHIIPLLISPVL